MTRPSYRIFAPGGRVDYFVMCWCILCTRRPKEKRAYNWVSATAFIMNAENC